MTALSRFRPNQEIVLALLMLFQGGCAFVFVFDILDDLAAWGGVGWLDMHLTVELLANFGLVAAVIVEGLFLRRLLRQHAHAERSLSAASGELDLLMQDYFGTWGLTPSEADVATFTIKGFSIAEIAQLRNSAEGTVKSQLNAIYRKSGLAGRGQLVSVLIEDLLSGPLPNRSAKLQEA